MENFKDILKYEIDALKDSIENLSAEINIPERDIYDWLSGKVSPSIDNLIKLCDYFGCSVDYLIGKESVKYDGIVFKKCPPFSQQLTSLMSAAGKRQIDVSLGTGIVTRQIFNLKTGRSQPTLDTLIKLANYFGITIDVLIGRQKL